MTVPANVREYWRAEGDFMRRAAFCAFYGHQQISELRALTPRQLDRFCTELSELVHDAGPFRIG